MTKTDLADAGHQVATNNQWNPKYSYGWQRAEILGALVNAAFLLALCVMIVIEAIQRFVEPQPITNPLLVLIIGSAGLAGNLIGLCLFHGMCVSQRVGEG